MGYPNGICLGGQHGLRRALPVTVTYTGLAGNVWVSASGAVPSDNGTLEFVQSDRQARLHRRQ